MFDFDALSNAIARQTVLCVGDLMLDEFVYGEVSRVSPEAPAPVIAVQRSEIDVGGAGNVARNIASLGARCIFVGLVGEDDTGTRLKAALAQESRIESVLVCDPQPADHPQGALRFRTFLDPHAARGLGTGEASFRRYRAEADRCGAAAPARCRRGAAVRLRQGRADGARPAQRDRRRAQARQACDRRSQESEPCRLSWCDAAQAQPQGIHRGDPHPHRRRDEHRGSRAGDHATCRLRLQCWSPKASRA